MRSVVPVRNISNLDTLRLPFARILVSLLPKRKYTTVQFKDSSYTKMWCKTHSVSCINLWAAKIRFSCLQIFSSYKWYICSSSRWVLITVCEFNYAQHFGTSCCLYFTVMESRLHKQFQSLLTSYGFVEVVFACSSFPYANKIRKFKIVIPYIQCYMIHIVLFVHV